MGKDTGWKKYFYDNRRYADLINGVGCHGEQIVKDTDLQDEDAFEVVIKYTNSKELVNVKDYIVEGGKNDVCKAIQDLMDVSRAKGREEGREELLAVLVKTLKEFHIPDTEIIVRLMKEFSMQEEEAKKYVSP